MNLRLACVIAVACAVSISACDNPTSQPSSTTAGPGSEVAPVPSVSVDADFVRDAGTAGLFEIQSSQIALQKSTNTDLTSFAQMMIDDHTKAANELKALVEGGSIQGVTALPSAPDSDQRRKLEELQAASGTDFDSKYHSMQLEAHQAAVSLFRSEAKVGVSASLKTWAGQTLPTLESHLARIQKITVQ